MVQIKPLEWEQRGQRWEADTFFGVYVVCDLDTYVHLRLHTPLNMNVGEGYANDTIAAAKAAAQADYDARILSAISVCANNAQAATPPAPASSGPVDGRCPRPCNGRPDDFSMRACIEAGECGCIAFSAPPAHTGDGWPVPEGWALVPKEPTPQMADAGRGYGDSAYNAIATYRAMLSAAPTPEDRTIPPKVVYDALLAWHGEDDEWSHNQYVAMDTVITNAIAALRSPHGSKGVKCAACGDIPTGDNDPCAVCGATSPQPTPGHGARLALANALESRWPALDASVTDINAVLAELTASGFTLAGTPKPVAWTDEASLKNLHYHNLVEVIGAHRNRTKKSTIALYRDPVPSDPDDWAAINGPCTPEGARIDAAVEAVASAIWERYYGVACLQEYDSGDTYGADEIADFVRSLKLKIRQDVELPPAPLGAAKEG